MVFYIQDISTHSQRSRCFSSTVVSSCQSPRRCSLEATTKSNWYCLADVRIQISSISQWFVVGSLHIIHLNVSQVFEEQEIPFTWSSDVPIEHHPTIRYMVYNGYYKVMSNIPKIGQLPTPVLLYWYSISGMWWINTDDGFATALSFKHPQHQHLWAQLRNRFAHDNHV